MLTFEWDKSLERMEVHADKDGLMNLVEQINRLIKDESNDHIHLMTEDWGGHDLSSDKQSPDSELIHHVKIYKWADE